MSRLFIATVAAAAILASPAARAQENQIRRQTTGTPGQVTRDTAKPREGTGGIRGRVFAADANGPLRRARVRLSSPEIQITRATTTDAEGRFEFKKLPAGRFTLNASKGSYVALDYGQRRPFERGRPIDLASGQVLEQVEFTLPRGCVITGRVIDDLGDPVADVGVSAMRPQYADGRRKPVPFGRGATTNDAGVYRLYGLPPGEYFVGTTFAPGQGGALGGADNEEGFVYAPTYYPGTPSLNDATRVGVKVGQERSGIDFMLVSSRTASISGTALNSRGMAALGASLMLGQTVTSSGGGMMRMMMSAAGGSTSVQPDGTFKLTGVAPGDYDLTLSVMNPETGEEEAASANISVNGVDITGVSLVVAPGGRATGVIVGDGGSPLPFGPRTLRLFTNAAPGVPTPFRMRASGGATIRNDGSFEIKGLDGPRTFRVGGLPAGWMLKSVLHDGRDITDVPLEFHGTEDISGIQVMLTNQVTTLSGSVSTASGDVVKEYSLVVFAEDPALWTAQSRYVATARPDQNGQFKIERLPPASYLAVALEYLEEGDASDPEFLNRVRDRASKFSLVEGESKSLSLKLATIDR